MAVDPKGKDSSNLPSLESIIAAGGNSSAARSLRVRSQLRDRLGRWIEMGRDSKLSFLDKLGELASTVGTFLGLSDREGYGRFYVKNDPVLGTGVYEFPTDAIEQIAATLDENYLVSKNIDVNGNKVKGVVAGKGIPAFADLTRTDLTPEDQDVLDNPLTAEEKDSQVKARLEAPAHESKNVIAKIDAADLEDMRKNNVDWEKYGVKAPVAETPTEPKDEHYDRRRKEFQDTITEANPELAASLFGDNPDAELKKNVEAELDKIDEVPNFSTKYGAYESVAQSLLEGTFTPSADGKVAWYPVVGKDNQSIGILDGASFYAKPERGRLLVFGDGANNYVNSLEEFEQYAPNLLAAHRERMLDEAKADLSRYDSNGEIAKAIDAGATGSEVKALLDASPEYAQDEAAASDLFGKDFLTQDERALSTRVTNAKSAIAKIDKAKPKAKARLEEPTNELDDVIAKLKKARPDLSKKIDEKLADIKDAWLRNDLKRAADNFREMSGWVSYIPDVGYSNPDEKPAYDAITSFMKKHNISLSAYQAPGGESAQKEYKEKFDSAFLEAYNEYRGDDSLEDFKKRLLADNPNAQGLDQVTNEMYSDDTEILKSAFRKIYNPSQTPIEKGSIEEAVDMAKKNQPDIADRYDSKLAELHDAWERSNTKKAADIIREMQGWTSYLPEVGYPGENGSAVYAAFTDFMKKHGIPSSTYQAPGGESIAKEHRDKVNADFDNAYNAYRGTDSLEDFKQRLLADDPAADLSGVSSEMYEDDRDILRSAFRKIYEQQKSGASKASVESVFKKLEDVGISDINNPDSTDENVKQARDTAFHLGNLIEKAASNGNVDKADLYNRLADSLLTHFQNKGEGKAAKPKVVGKADTIQKITGRKEGATLDAYSLSQPRKGIAVALEGTNEEIVDTIFFDDKLGKLALAEYLETNKDKLSGGFKLGTWHDKDNNEVTLDIIELFPEANQPEAETAGQERNQQGIFKLSNKEYISTGGTGDRGRARRERELARQSGGGSVTNQELGQPDSRGEGRPSVQPPRVSNIPDEWSADRLRNENGVIPNSVYTERADKGKELGVILPSSDPLIGVPVTGDTNEDAKNFIRASRQLIIDGASSSPREQKKFAKRFNEIDLLLAKGYTPLALENLSALGMDFNNFYHSDGRDKVFGISSSTDASEVSMDLYWYGRTASQSSVRDVVPQSAAPIIQDAEGFALDVDDLGDALKKSPTLTKDKDEARGINVAQVIKDLANSKSTAETVDILHSTSNALINGYLRTQFAPFEVEDIENIVSFISATVRKHKARKQSDHPEDPFHRVDSTPSDGGDDDLGSDPSKTTHLEKFKQVIDEIIADEDITEFFDASTADFYFNKAAQAATPEEYVKAITDLHNKIWERMSIDEEWHETEIQDNPLFPFARRIEALKQSAPMNFEKLQENQPDMSASVSADRLAELQLNTRSIDRNKLSDAQKSILRKLSTTRTNALNNLKNAAQTRNRSQYEFQYQVALAATRTIKKLVANSEARGESYKFGSGEEDRIDNFIIFEDSITTLDSNSYRGENDEPKVNNMQGLYVSKSGKVYFMTWDGTTSYAKTIRKDGSIGQNAGYVQCNWSGESARGPEFANSVTPSMLKTYDRYQRDGIGGANITFARLVAEKSGRHFAHSSALTNMGANNSKGIDPSDPQRHNLTQQDKVLWMMKAPIFDVMRDNGWFSATRYFQMNGYNKSFEVFDRPLDPAGWNNDSGKMVGPFYNADMLAVSAMSAIRNKIQRGDKLIAGADYPAYLQTHVEAQYGDYGSFGLQSLMRELSYKDGKSVDEVLDTLKTQKSQLEYFRNGLTDELVTNGDYTQYNLDKERTNSQQLIDFMGELIPLVENNKEKLDNPEARINRPKPFAKDSFKTVKKQPYGETEGQVGVIKLKDVPYAEILNDYPGSVDNSQKHITEAHYQEITGKAMPDGWTYDPHTLARRFSEEDLKNALTNVLASKKDDKENFAELDFGRKYGAPSIGYVNPYYLKNALYHQIGESELNSWLAQTADGISAVDVNSKILAEKNAPKINLVAEMDKLLAKAKLKPLEKIQKEARSENNKFSQYKPELGWVTSVKNVSDRYGTRFLSGLYPLLPNNDRFDLTNGIEDALGGVFDEGSLGSMDKSYGSQNAKHIAWNFESKGLEDALVDALNTGRSTIQLRFIDSEHTQTVPLAAVRDALQHQGVDTNELVKKRVTTIAPPVDEASLNAIGRMIPERPEAALLHGSSTIDITSFERVKKQNIYDMQGVNSPRLMRDPVTKKLYVVKPISSDVEGWGGRARDQEILTQALYRVMGVRASRPQLGVDNSISIAPQEYVVSEFVPETDNTTYEKSVFWNPDTNNPVLEAARHGLAADILLDHIDGTFNSGNTVIDEDGNIVRIDGGGGLLWDPVPGHGPKNSEGTQRRLSQENVSRWLANATPEQAALLEKAMRDGTFEGEGIDFSFDFFLNKNGWHWYPNTGIRSRILEGITDEKMKQYVIETVLPLTPDKIETVAGIVRDKGDRERVISTLISRRQAILDRYGIEDTYMTDEDRMSRMQPTDDQINQFYHLAGTKITTDAERVPYLAEFNAQFAAGTVTSLDIERRIVALQNLTKPSTSDADDATAEETSKIVELAYALYPDQQKERDAVINKIVLRPYGTKSGPFAREQISELQAMLAERAQPTPSAADAINTIEEKRTAVIQNGVDTTIYPALPKEASRLIVDSRELKFGDILAETSPEFKELGRVVFNAVGVDGKNTVAYVDKDKRVQFKTYPSSELVETVVYPEDTRPMQSDIPEGQSNRDLRNSIQNLQVARSRVVLDEIKNEYPNHVELENGDLVISSRTFTTAGGATYRYEVMVHRTPSEEFVSYVRETPLNAAGEVIGATTINKISPETHSAKHLKNRIAPLLVGNSVGKGIHGRNPRNWFNQGNNREIEVIHPATGLPVPRSMAPENLDTKYIGNTGIPVTGDGVKDALIGYVADLVDRKVDLGSLLLRLSNQRIVSRSQINDIIERIQANRRFPGVSQIPYLSRDGENPVRVGDRVRHYMTDGTVKEGVVRKRRPLSVSRKPNGDYGYSDVLVVKFDGRAQGTPIVAKHLEILRRADGSPASIRGEEPEPVVSAPFLPLPESAIAEGIEISDENERFRNYKNTSNGKNGSVTQMPRVYGTQGDRFVGEVWEGERTGRPNQTSQFDDRNVAQAWVLNNIRQEDSDITVYSASSAEDEDLGSPATPAQVTPARSGSPIRQTLEDRMEEDNSNPSITLIKFNDIPGYSGEKIADVLPTYGIHEEKGRKKVILWSKSDKLGDPKQGTAIILPKNASEEFAREVILKNAEDRLKYDLESVTDAEGKRGHTYSIELSDGTVIESDVISYEEYNLMKDSTVTGSHVNTDGKGKLVFSDERIKFHRDLIERLIAGVEPPKKRNPIMFFLGGGPASGKGNFTGAEGKKYGVPAVRSFNDVTGEEEPLKGADAPGAVKIDPDEIKILLPEVREMHARQMMRRVEKALGLPPIFTTGIGDRKWAENAHEESSILGKLLQKTAVTKGLDIVYDGTGDGKRQGITDKLKPAKAAGYKTVGLYMTTDLPTAIGSAMMRKLRTGRHVPGSTQYGIYFTLAKLIDPSNKDTGNISELFDSWTLLHRNPLKIDKKTGEKVGGGFIKVAETDENKKLVIGKEEEGAPIIWREFLDLGKLAGDKEAIKAIVKKGEAYYRELKSKQDRDDAIALQEKGKKKMDASDLKDSDPRVLEIRSIINSIAAQTGLTANTIAQNTKLFQMILNNSPMSEIMDFARNLKRR